MFSLRAQIQGQNPSAKGCRSASSEILSKFWCVNFSIGSLPYPHFILHCELLEICFPLTPCCEYTKCPPASTTHSREKKIKVTGRSLKVYFQTACTRVKAILSSERQQQELWPYFWYSTCYRPFLFVSVVDITWILNGTFFKERKKVPGLRLYWSVPPW